MELDTLHKEMKDLYINILIGRREGENTIVRGQHLDGLINKCSNGEYCEQCGYLFCPWREILHFHHDGCPCCSMVPDESWNQESFDRVLHARHVLGQELKYE